MSSDQIRDLEERIAELKRRLPAHSASPAMMQELDDLEEELETLRKEAKADNAKAEGDG